MLKQVTDTYLVECTRSPPESTLADHDTRLIEKNNIWNSNLAQSLFLDSGDMINLESAMIQSSIDDGLIELTGTDDTRGSLTCAYYLGNDWVFTCPLPLENSNVRSDFFYTTADPNTTVIDGAAAFNLQRWSEEYGEVQFDSTSPTSSVTAPITDIEKNTMLIRPSKNLTPSYERMYLGEDYFHGLYANGRTSNIGGVTFESVYKLKTSTIDFDIPTGFYSPQNLTQLMTNAMHDVDGNCSKTNTGFVPSLVNNAVGSIRYNVSDNMSKVVPTTPGLDQHYKREFGDTVIQDLSEQHPEDYQRKILYRNLLTTEPNRLSAAGHFYSGVTTSNAFKCNQTALEDFSTKQVYTGFQYSESNIPLIPTGNFGLQVVVNDFLPTKPYTTDGTQTPSYYYLQEQQIKGHNFANFTTVFADTFARNDLGVLDLQDGDVVWTNLIANDTNFTNIKKAFDLLQHPIGTADTLVADIDLGRGDDFRCFSTESDHFNSDNTFSTRDIHSFNLLSPVLRAADHLVAQS